jgi:hypothetical protein
LYIGAPAWWQRSSKSSLVLSFKKELLPARASHAASGIAPFRQFDYSID